MTMMNTGLLSYVSRKRNEVVKEAPKKKHCPKCKKNRGVGFFGVRTHKDAKGKPVRFSLQSWCVDCRGAK